MFVVVAGGGLVLGGFFTGGSRACCTRVVLVSGRCASCGRVVLGAMAVGRSCDHRVSGSVSWPHRSRCALHNISEG